MIKRQHLSVDHEPAFGDGTFPTDPAEHEIENRVPPREEIDQLRDSVTNEPWRTDTAAGPSFGEWLVRRRHQTTLAGNLWYTLLAGVVGGPFAIAGAFLSGRPGMVQVVYIVIMGPVVEELLKQSGMIYLLERIPYRVFSAWQFVLAATVSALIFATLENLMYVHVYALASELKHPEMFAAYRWTVCTALHLSCSIIASLGLIRVWRRVITHGEPADLAYGYPLFAVAIVLHGLYNTAALFLDHLF